MWLEISEKESKKETENLLIYFTINHEPRLVEGKKKLRGR